MNRKHKSDKVIGLIVIALLVFGLMVIYAIGPMTANYINAAYGTERFGTNSFFLHQLFSVIASIVVFFLAFKIPYGKIKKFSKWVMILSLLTGFLLAFLAMINSPIANCAGGGCRWFKLGSLSFQPAEFIKLGLVLYLSELASRCKKEDKLDTSDFWTPFVVMSGISLFLVVVSQNDLGSGVSLLAIILAILFMSGVPLRRFLLVIVFVLVGGFLAIVLTSHRMERIMTFLGGGSSDKSYQIENAMIAIGTGGFAGVGIGNSLQATGYLPESINDAIFAVMGETFGFVGLTIIVLIFMLLLSRLLKVSERIGDDEYQLITVGVFAWIGSQVIINIAAMTGLIPLTGITLPFLSYGGTSMLFTAAALGLCLQISCYTGREGKHNESISSGRRFRGTHHANSSSRS